MSFVEGTPTVVVDLDRPRTLAFTLGAMRRIKEQLGTLEVGSLVGPEAALKVPACIWACMDAESRKEVSLEALEEMIHPGNLGAISEAVTRLFTASTPEASAEAGPTGAGPEPAAT